MLLRGDAQQRAKAKELASDLLASDTAEYFKVRLHASAYVSIRPHTVSIRQHTSAYISIHQHTSA